MGYHIEVKEIPSSFTSHDEYHEYLMCEIEEGNNVDENIDLLFKSTYRFGYKQLQKFKNIEDDIDYLLSLMSIAFMKSVKKYKTKNNNSFCALYFINIKNEILMEYYCKEKGNRKLKNDYNKYFALSLDKTFVEEKDYSFDSGLDNAIRNRNDMSTEEKIENKLICRDIFNAIDRVFVPEKVDKRAMKNLKRNKEIFTIYLEAKVKGEKISTDEIGTMFDIDGSNVRRIIKKYKELLREELVKIDIRG